MILSNIAEPTIHFVRHNRNMRKASTLTTVSATIVILLLLAAAPVAGGDSVASKNKEGNSLFLKGKYQEAEKRYLDAEVQSPGRSELLYNLGNSLIKQKKYQQALQSLRQAASKGDKGLQQSSWYNAGNALFEMGNYKDSAQAYIEALRLNPADRDAKFNLELALQKMKQQKQSGSGKTQNENPTQDQESGKNQPSRGSESRQQDKQKPESGLPQQDQARPANPQATQAQQHDGSLSKERALQILDAMKSQELAEQRKLQEKRSVQRPNARDW